MDTLRGHDMLPAAPALAACPPGLADDCIMRCDIRHNSTTLRTTLVHTYAVELHPLPVIYITLHIYLSLHLVQ